MPAKAYILVPSDGSRETVLNSADVRKMPIIENNDTETRLSGLMDQRGIDVPFWLVGGGVMIYGDREQARGVSNIVEQLPSLVAARTAPAADANGAGRMLQGAFDQAARQFTVEPVRFAFNQAANDSARPVVPASRPNIRGGYGFHAA